VTSIEELKALIEETKGEGSYTRCGCCFASINRTNCHCQSKLRSIHVCP
jgi:hypothetical protein